MRHQKMRHRKMRHQGGKCDTRICDTGKCDTKVENATPEYATPENATPEYATPENATPENATPKMRHRKMRHQAVDNARNIMPANVRGQKGTSAASMGRSYRNYVTRERAEHGDELLDRADPAQIVIPDRLQEQTIFDDVVDARRMFVFASPFARNILAQYGQHVAIDGTLNVMEIEPIDEIENVDEYGAYRLVDQHIRNWIEQNAYQQRRALFPMEIWNVCASLKVNF
ncbi:hypothetical protein GPALN_010377 [Globodera pallida]|nr:hypothetical protein GPALN_010377 [Globodera pallida]